MLRKAVLIFVMSNKLLLVQISESHAVAKCYQQSCLNCDCQLWIYVSRHIFRVGTKLLQKLNIKPGLCLE